MGTRRRQILLKCLSFLLLVIWPTLVDSRQKITTITKKKRNAACRSLSLPLCRSPSLFLSLLPSPSLCLSVPVPHSLSPRFPVASRITLLYNTRVPSYRDTLFQLETSAAGWKRSAAAAAGQRKHVFYQQTPRGVRRIRSPAITAPKARVAGSFRHSLSRTPKERHMSASATETATKTSLRKQPAAGRLPPRRLPRPAGPKGHGVVCWPVCTPTRAHGDPHEGGIYRADALTPSTPLSLSLLLPHL